MHSFGDFLRGRLPALALGLTIGFGAMATVGLGAPAALAQQKSSKEFVEAYDVGRKAAASKDWNTVISAADKATPFAKEKAEKMAVINLRISGYQGLGKKPELIKAIEDQLAMGGLPPETVKNQKTTLAGLYDETHNPAKAADITKELIKDGGGSADQNAYVGSYALRGQKNYKEAISYTNIAIDKARKANQKPKEAWYQIVSKAYFDQNDLPNFYATIERQAADYPKPDTMKIVIERAYKEPHFDRANHQLDVYRALDAAKVTLTPQQRSEMGELSISRGNSAESAKIFSVLEKSGWAGIDPAKATRFKNMYGKAQTDAKADATTLPAREKDAAAAGKGEVSVDVGDTYLGAGDNAKAIDQIQKGLAKGNMDEGQVAYAKLQLGIAQYHAGKKDDARKTWGEIKADNGAAVLARSWALISKE